MRPLALHGHERAITQIRYNTEGDLLFSASKDNTPNVWYSINGERLGTFDGHNGAVWTIDCNWDSTKVATGSADSTLKLWDCETGKCLNTLETTTSVRTCSFSYSGKLLLYTTDDIRKMQPEINVIDITTGEHLKGESAVLSIKDADHKKAFAALWGPLDESFITGHESGNMVKWDLRSGEPLIQVTPHKLQINDLQFNKDQTLIISASKDKTAKLFDAYTLDHMKTYTTERPVNSAAISPLFDHVVIGGGQEAMEVTTTASESGKFESRFFHLIFEEEFATVKGHFGPIQSLAFHPDGKSYASGAEDGFIRIQSFDDSYFNFRMEYE